MKILLCTSQDISRRLAEFFFLKKDIDLTIVTQVTKRDRIYGYESAVDFCEQQGIPCWQPQRLDKDFVEKVRVLNPDLIVAAYFPQIFPQDLLDIPRLGAVNVHPGDLPYYRGKFAIPWTILNGEHELTVTLHYIVSQVDVGDIIAKRQFPLSHEETGFELYLRAMHLAADLLMECFDDLVQGKLGRLPQVGYGSYYNQLERRYCIDWHRPREQVKRLVRVHAKPYLPAYTYLANRCIYINRVSFYDADVTATHGAGFIARVFEDKRFAVACVDGWILVEEYEVYPILDDLQFSLHFFEGARLE